MQATGQTHKESGQYKGTQFDVKTAHAHLQRNVFVIAHRAQRERQRRAQQQLGEHHGQRGDRQCQPVELMKWRGGGLQHNARGATEGPDIHHQYA